jgi:hypothetical protein
VFAGMVDGSIAMWDLREPMSIHQPTVVNDESYSLRYPTYDTGNCEFYKSALIYGGGGVIYF